MPTEVTVRRCDECGLPLINVSAGAVCANGHGRIQPLNHQLENRRAMREFYKMSVKDAKIVPLLVAAKEPHDKYFNRAIYAIDGEVGLWRRTKRTGKGIKLGATAASGAKVAVLGDGLAEFVRYAELEEVLRACGFNVPTPVDPATLANPAAEKQADFTENAQVMGVDPGEQLTDKSFDTGVAEDFKMYDQMTTEKPNRPGDGSPYPSDEDFKKIAAQNAGKSATV